MPCFNLNISTTTPSNETLLDPQVIVWVLGEYGHLVAANPGAGIGSGSSSCNSIAQLMDRLVAALETHRASDLIKGYTLTALAKLLAHGSAAGTKLTAAAASLAKQACSSSDVELQQRGHELLALAKCVGCLKVRPRGLRGGEQHIWTRVYFA